MGEPRQPGKIRVNSFSTIGRSLPINRCLWFWLRLDAELVSALDGFAEDPSPALFYQHAIRGTGKCLLTVARNLARQMAHYVWAIMKQEPDCHHGSSSQRSTPGLHLRSRRMDRAAPSTKPYLRNAMIANAEQCGSSRQARFQRDGKRR